MDLATLRLFVDVAERLSFASVGRDRSMDPSLVSRAIGGLEAEIGARLFQRTTRTMTLTEAGERYLSRIRPHLDGLDAAQDALADAGRQPTGLLRLTASAAFGEAMLLPLLPKFRAEFPELQLELLLSDNNLDLIADRIDIAIRLAPSFRADVIGVKLFATNYHVVASADYAARTGALASPEDLGARDCLLFAQQELRTRWIFQSEGQTGEVGVQGHVISSSAAALRLAALAGLGPALLADWLVGRDLACGALVDLLPDHAFTPTSFDTAAWLLYPSREHLPRKTRLVVDFIREEFGKRQRTCAPAIGL